MTVVKLPSTPTSLALLALFASVATGSASAVSGSVDRNSIKTRHIAPNAVRSQDVAPGAIGASDLNGVPNGRMSKVNATTYAEQPIFYDQVDFASPKNAFSTSRGAFTAPTDGTYLVVGTVEWSGAGTRNLTIAAGLAPFTVVARSDGFTGPGTQTVTGIVRLKQNDPLTMFVDTGQAADPSTGASLAVSFLSN